MAWRSAAGVAVSMCARVMLGRQYSKWLPSISKICSAVAALPLAVVLYGAAIHFRTGGKLTQQSQIASLWGAHKWERLLSVQAGLYWLGLVELTHTEVSHTNVEPAMRMTYMQLDVQLEHTLE